jgi:hypothetical protein
LNYCGHEIASLPHIANCVLSIFDPHPVSEASAYKKKAKLKKCQYVLVDELIILVKSDDLAFAQIFPTYTFIFRLRIGGAEIPIRSKPLGRSD